MKFQNLKLKMAKTNKSSPDPPQQKLSFRGFNNSFFNDMVWPGLLISWDISK